MVEKKCVTRSKNTSERNDGGCTKETDPGMCREKDGWEKSQKFPTGPTATPAVNRWESGEATTIGKNNF